MTSKKLDTEHQNILPTFNYITADGYQANSIVKQMRLSNLQHLLNADSTLGGRGQNI
jgi:hypothetical protein